MKGIHRGSGGLREVIGYFCLIFTGAFCFAPWAHAGAAPGRGGYGTAGWIDFDFPLRDEVLAGRIKALVPRLLMHPGVAESHKDTLRKRCLKKIVLTCPELIREIGFDALWYQVEPALINAGASPQASKSWARIQSAMGQFQGNGYRAAAALNWIAASLDLAEKSTKLLDPNRVLALARRALPELVAYREVSCKLPGRGYEWLDQQLRSKKYSSHLAQRLRKSARSALSQGSPPGIDLNATPADEAELLAGLALTPVGRSAVIALLDDAELGVADFRPTRPREIANNLLAATIRKKFNSKIVSSAVYRPYVPMGASLMKSAHELKHAAQDDKLTDGAQRYSKASKLAAALEDELQRATPRQSAMMDPRFNLLAQTINETIGIANSGTKQLIPFRVLEPVKTFEGWRSEQEGLKAKLDEMIRMRRSAWAGSKSLRDEIEKFEAMHGDPEHVLQKMIEYKRIKSDPKAVRSAYLRYLNTWRAAVLDRLRFNDERRAFDQEQAFARELKAVAPCANSWISNAQNLGKSVPRYPVSDRSIVHQYDLGPFAQPSSSSGI